MLPVFKETPMKYCEKDTLQTYKTITDKINIWRQVVFSFFRTQQFLLTTFINKVVMNLDSNILSTLKAPGVLAPVLAADVAIVLVVIYLFMYVVSPTVEMYKRSKALEEIAGPTKRHWIYGHNKEVSWTTCSSMVISFSNEAVQKWATSIDQHTIRQKGHWRTGDNDCSIYPGL